MATFGAPVECAAVYELFSDLLEPGVVCCLLRSQWELSNNRGTGLGVTVLVLRQSEREMWFWFADHCPEASFEDLTVAGDGNVMDVFGCACVGNVNVLVYFHCGKITLNLAMDIVWKLQ